MWRTVLRRKYGEYCKISPEHICTYARKLTVINVTDLLVSCSSKLKFCRILISYDFSSSISANTR